jgi:hypothetical protein
MIDDLSRSLALSLSLTVLILLQEDIFRDVAANQPTLHAVAFSFSA